MERLAFSADGFWIIYQGREVDGTTFDLYLIAVGSTERIRLTTDPGNDFEPAWRPSAP